MMIWNLIVMIPLLCLCFMIGLEIGRRQGKEEGGLEWTRKKPTKLGWYCLWGEELDGAIVAMVKITEIDLENGRLVSGGHTINANGVDYWYGPIELPPIHKELKR